jgi:hypothetical protein
VIPGLRSLRSLTRGYLLLPLRGSFDADIRVDSLFSSRYQIRRREQSRAADGAIACFSSNRFPISMNADRAPQLGCKVGRRPLLELDFVNNSSINWKLVAYTVGACWLIFAFMLLLGDQLLMFLNPLPLLVKAIFGMLVFGYMGSTGGQTLDYTAIFVYWTLIGLGLSWLLHNSKHKPAIIALTALLHLVLSALTLFPMMLLNGR